MDSIMDPDRTRQRTHSSPASLCPQRLPMPSSPFFSTFSISGTDPIWSSVAEPTTHSFASVPSAPSITNDAYSLERYATSRHQAPNMGHLIQPFN